LWSQSSVTDVDSMYQRLESISRMLDWAGLKHRVNYEPMLERLAGERPSDSLRVLADASEALGIEGRRDARHYTSLVDLNRFVDAARPESENVRRMERAVQKLSPATVGSASEIAELRSILTAWAENEALLQSPGEVAGLSKHLSVLGSIGLRALEYLQSGQTAPSGWIDQQMALLKEMERPEAEVNLAAVRPVRKLLEAAARRSVSKGNK
jgi:hexosaminidase